jgi:hypothetical protein
MLRQCDVPAHALETSARWRATQPREVCEEAGLEYLL